MNTIAHTNIRSLCVCSERMRVCVCRVRAEKKWNLYVLLEGSAIKLTRLRSICVCACVYFCEFCFQSKFGFAANEIAYRLKNGV